MYQQLTFVPQTAVQSSLEWENVLDTITFIALIVIAIAVAYWAAMAIIWFVKTISGKGRYQNPTTRPRT